MILEHFKTICSIPHCSNGADQLRDFLVNFAKKRGYKIYVDEAKNILAKKDGAKLAIQAHYDMVCVGKAPNIELIEDSGYLMAKDSSLGADNGIGIAMMMALMDKGARCEFIFTSDEEIGLVGASKLEFDLESRYMLNLDSEDEAEVYIGCAGGVDIKAVKRYKRVLHDCNFYEINIENLKGGHSGVDIDKDIPNAIKLFANFLKDYPAKIAYLKGGERINSIPSTLRAIVTSKKKISSTKHIDVRRIEARFEVIEDSKEILDLLESFENGVISFDDELDVVKESVNLAIVDLIDGELSVEVSARAMDDDGLKSVEKSVKEHFSKYGFDVTSDGKYPAWRPEINEFSKLVCEANKKVFGNCEYKAIHAGLECAIISSRYPDMKIASIGPTIISPHSKGERVDLYSVDRVYDVVKKIVKRVNSL